MARGHVVAQIHDDNGNVLGRAHMNSILDTVLYHEEFAGDKVKELTNVIAKSMIAQCDAEGNEYLFMDLLIDYWKDGNSISLSDQQTSV